jgi:hypothetical protein
VRRGDPRSRRPQRLVQRHHPQRQDRRLRRRRLLPLDPTYASTVGCSSGYDAVTIINGAHHIWVDHCDISDGTDGNLDVSLGSDNVTISWTKFHYTSRTDPVGNDSTGAYGHRFSNLVGGADNLPGDVGLLNVTWHHDWWADHAVERMPRVRYGKNHIFNNLYSSSGNNYCARRRRHRVHDAALRVHPRRDERRSGGRAERRRTPLKRPGSSFNSRSAWRSRS